MSLENVGIGGLLTFNGEQAITGMTTATAATNAFAKSQTGLTSVMSSVAGGLNQFGSFATKSALAFAPFTGILALGFDKAAKFEQQMSAVKAVSIGTAEDMAMLTAKAKELGATSVFNSTEVGKGMEELSRAGAETGEIMKGIGGVLDAAAADNIDLATSASIVSNVVRGMGLDFGQATHVADVLALASAKTNTDMVGLGESFKYAAAAANNMKIPLETTTALLGAAADSGLKGSIGGTSFTAMLNKLASPSKKGAAFLAAHNIQMTKTATGGLDVVNVMHQLHNAFASEGDVVTKAAAAHDLFGDRGSKAFNAINASIDAGRLDKLVEELNHADGAAKKMAQTRLDNFSGQLKLLTNNLESFAIEIGGQFLGVATENVKNLAHGLQGVIGTLQALNGVTKANRQELEEKFGPVAVAIGYGIAEAVHMVIGAWTSLRNTVIGFVTTFAGSASPQVIQSIAKWATMFVIVAGALAPVLGALGGVALFVSHVILPALSMIGTAFTVLGQIAAFVAGDWMMVFGAALFAMHNEGESFGQLMERVWNTATTLVNWFVDNAVMPFVNMFQQSVIPAINAAKQTVYLFVLDAQVWFQELFGGIILAAQRLAPLFSAVFQGLATIIGWFVKGVIAGFGFILDAVKPVFEVVKEFGIWLIENIVNGLQKVVKLAVKAADALSLSKNSPMWADLAMFASQPEFKITDTAGKLASINAIQDLGKIAPPEAAPGTDFVQDAVNAANARAKQKGAAAKQPNINVGVDLKDERSLQIDNCLTVNGRNMAVAMAQHKQEISERAGFRATPWQRRQIAEQGAAPVGGMGGGAG